MAKILTVYTAYDIFINLDGKWKINEFEIQLEVEIMEFAYRLDTKQETNKQGNKNLNDATWLIIMPLMKKKKPIQYFQIFFSPHFNS